MLFLAAPGLFFTFILSKEMKLNTELLMDIAFFELNIQIMEIPRNLFLEDGICSTAHPKP